MGVRANLLPAVFARRRCERRRRRAWAVACMVLATVEGLAALYVGRQAREVRRGREEVARLTAEVKQAKAERDTLQTEAERIVRNTAVAERLRDKHLWSRWLGSLSFLVPEHVVLTAVETEPAQFNGIQNASFPGGRTAANAAAESSVRLLRLRGSAARHEDLMALYKAMNGLEWFRSVQLEEAKREVVFERETIGFALACGW